MHSKPKVKVIYGIQQLKLKSNNRLRSIETVAEYIVSRTYTWSI